MPDGMEFFVRPFQSPGSHGTIIIPSTPSGTREKAVLTWGARSKMPEVVPKSVGFTTQCCTEGLKEDSRKSDIVRIEQDGNPNNWVDVARAREVNLSKEEKNSCGGSLQAELDASWGALFANMDKAFRPLGTSADDGKKNCQVSWQLSNVG